MNAERFRAQACVALVTGGTRGIGGAIANAFEAGIEAIEAEPGPIDILVNNAAGFMIVSILSINGGQYCA